MSRTADRPACGVRWTVSARENTERPGVLNGSVKHRGFDGKETREAIVGEGFIEMRKKGSWPVYTDSDCSVNRILMNRGNTSYPNVSGKRSNVTVYMLSYSSDCHDRYQRVVSGFLQQARCFPPDHSINTRWSDCGCDFRAGVPGVSRRPDSRGKHDPTPPE